MAAEDGGAVPVVVTTVTGREGWKERIYVPTMVAGIVGGGASLFSNHRHAFGTANLAATFATNLAIITGSYCSSREVVREFRGSNSGDLLNSAIGGFASGALLGRFQAGIVGAVRYSLLFAVAGTTLDYATMRLTPIVQSYWDSMPANIGRSSEWRFPDWSPIQVLDEEALAAKRTKEQKLYAQRMGGKFDEKD